MKTIKTYILKAFRMELIEKNPFIFFKMKTVKNQPEYLTIEERDLILQAYENGELSEKLHRVARWFLFSCFTGLRISDLRAIKHENIQFDILSFKPVKTMNVNGNKVFLPLGKMAVKLIKEEGTKKGTIFNCYSEAKMNLYVKELAAFVGLQKDISFHTARHTFATAFLEKSKSAKGLLVLQRLLGHAKLDSTLVYSHIIDADIVNAIKEFN